MIDPFGPLISLRSSGAATSKSSIVYRFSCSSLFRTSRTAKLSYFHFSFALFFAFIRQPFLFPKRLASLKRAAFFFCKNGYPAKNFVAAPPAFYRRGRLAISDCFTVLADCPECAVFCRGFPLCTLFSAPSAFPIGRSPTVGAPSPTFGSGFGYRRRKGLMVDNRVA